MQLRLDQLPAHLSKGAGALKPVYSYGTSLCWPRKRAMPSGPRLGPPATPSARCTPSAARTSTGRACWARPAKCPCSATSRSSRSASPRGKPGKDGSQALQQYCDAAQGNDGLLTLITLPRLDKTQLNSAWFTALDGTGLTLRCDPIERAQLPLWIAQRLSAQGQQVEPGEAGQRTLAFFADRVEGNLARRPPGNRQARLAAPARHPRHHRADRRRRGVDVARFNVFKLSEAVLSGQIERTCA